MSPSDTGSLDRIFDGFRMPLDDGDQNSRRASRLRPRGVPWQHPRSRKKRTGDNTTSESQGRRWPGYRVSAKADPVGEYIIYYHTGRDRILISRVLHGRRQQKQASNGRLLAPHTSGRRR